MFSKAYKRFCTICALTCPHYNSAIAGVVDDEIQNIVFIYIYFLNKVLELAGRSTCNIHVFEPD